MIKDAMGDQLDRMGEGLGLKRDESEPETFVEWVARESKGELLGLEYGLPVVVLPEGSVCQLPNKNVHWLTKDLIWNCVEMQSYIYPSFHPNSEEFKDSDMHKALEIADQEMKKSPELERGLRSNVVLIRCEPTNEEYAVVRRPINEKPKIKKEKKTGKSRYQIAIERARRKDAKPIK